MGILGKGCGGCNKIRICVLILGRELLAQFRRGYVGIGGVVMGCSTGRYCAQKDKPARKAARRSIYTADTPGWSCATDAANITTAFGAAPDFQVRVSPTGLRRDYLCRLWSFLSITSLKIDLLPPAKSLEALHLDVGVVDEKVIAAIIRSNETVTLLVIEPLYRTTVH